MPVVYKFTFVYLLVSFTWLVNVMNSVVPNTQLLYCNELKFCFKAVTQIAQKYDVSAERHCVWFVLFCNVIHRGSLPNGLC